MEYFIYFLLNRKRVVYIGITKNIGSRIYGHHSSKKFDSVRTINVLNKDVALRYESRLIKLFNPKYNKTFKRGDIQKINISIPSELGDHIYDTACKYNLSVPEYIKAVLKKHSKFKEKPLL